ncbi:hypothetical protein CH352_07055 [Leptospira hartskeerlii]|uniref:DUF1566 domain-containing protein n=1 Tax=Leptospira hartskeerlii TaxID=2023177 RepID=A0A2M9XF70_9LEPT|nr:hypothetical protein [Leptospira hartskeerlii]PJZ26323.1 hypothetical protein CH357_07460 [Leptospira hartskeerlii]PJZ34408.1 hypothetical protein CH352_07055 [Leptospira hartskeerlii]
MKRLTVLFLFSYLSLINCGSGPSQDLSGLLLLLAGGGGNSFHCGQTVANPVSFASANGNFVDETSLLTALGGDNCSTPSLTNNENGTVIDATNKFLWTLCVIDGNTGSPHTYSTPNCGVFTGADVGYDQSGGATVCSNLTYAGHSDWILPDAIQLHVLRTASTPFALGAFGSANNSIADGGTPVWSSTIISSSLGITPLYEANNVFQAFTVTSVSQAIVICMAKL